MNKPTLIKSMQLPPMRSHRRERYLPTAFDESLTIIERINKIIHWLNEYSDLTEEMLIKWNEVYGWVMNEGLDNAIGDRLNEWLKDGTFYRIINEEIFEELNNRINSIESRFDKVVDDVNETLENAINEMNETLENAINEMNETINQVINDLNTQFNEFKEDIEEVVAMTVDIIVSKDEPTIVRKNSFWYEVV